MIGVIQYRASLTVPNGIPFQVRLYRFSQSNILYVGGMQDWIYLNSNCFDVTIELNCAKYPLEFQLVHLWHENQFPLLAYINQVSDHF